MATFTYEMDIFAEKLLTIMRRVSRLVILNLRSVALRDILAYSYLLMVNYLFEVGIQNVDCNLYLSVKPDSIVRLLDIGR